jgi:pyruvate ferredoxin oxidoreductase beta subunit
MEELALSGNPACQGCGALLALRHVLKALGKNSILVIPAGCTSIISGFGLKATFNVPVLHMAFAAAPAAASGVSRALKKIGVGDVNVVVWAGDGSTFDIGFGSLSGAAERNENILYICNDNEAYMNTGIQKSGATPMGAWTTTTVKGREGLKKDLFSIMLDHRVPYVATASPAYPLDLVRKVKKALSIYGFKLIHLFDPCPPGWRHEFNLTIEVAKKAVLSGVWILMEAENGVLKLNPPSSTMLDKRRLGVKDYLSIQGRFKHLSEEEIAEIQKTVDEYWDYIKKLL